MVGRLTSREQHDSGFGSRTRSGGVPGQIGVCTWPGEGCQMAACALGAIAATASAAQAAADQSRIGAPPHSPSSGARLACFSPTRQRLRLQPEPEKNLGLKPMREDAAKADGVDWPVKT